MMKWNANLGLGCRFDGDGMLHACRIKNGKVSYCNKLVDTFKLMQEKAAGCAIFAKVRCQSFGQMHCPDLHCEWSSFNNGGGMPDNLACVFEAQLKSSLTFINEHLHVPSHCQVG